MAISDKDIENERRIINEIGLAAYHKKVLKAKANKDILPTLVAMVTVGASLAIAFIKSEKDIFADMHLILIFFLGIIYFLAHEIEKGTIKIELYDELNDDLRKDNECNIDSYMHSEKMLVDRDMIYWYIGSCLLGAWFFVLGLIICGLHVSIILKGIFNMVVAIIYSLINFILNPNNDNYITLIVLLILMFVLYKQKIRLRNL